MLNTHSWSPEDESCWIDPLTFPLMLPREWFCFFSKMSLGGIAMKFSADIQGWLIDTLFFFLLTPVGIQPGFQPGSAAYGIRTTWPPVHLTQNFIHYRHSRFPDDECLWLQLILDVLRCLMFLWGWTEITTVIPCFSSGAFIKFITKYLPQLYV